jgi:hypothetical protein
MTHDELLAKIHFEYASTYEDWCGNVPISPKALYEVVKLHKPIATNDTVFCNVCWDISEQHNLQVMPVLYPCSTIQAIEKKWPND